GGDRTLHQRGDFAGFPHHFRKAVGGNHDEADHGQHFHAFGKQIVGFFPLHHAGDIEQYEAGQGAQNHGAEPELHHERHGNGDQRHHQRSGAVFHIHTLGLFDALEVIAATAPVAEEDRNQQAKEH